MISPMPGTRQSAAATVISQAAAFVYALVFLLRRRSQFGFDFRLKSFALRRRQAGILLKLGLPIALQNTAVGTSIIVVNAWINSLGIVAAAVAGVGQKLQNIVSIMSEAVATAVATLTGQNMGAGEQARVKRTVWLAWALDLGFFAVMAAAFLLFPTQVFALFTNDAAVLAYAPSFMVACVVTMFGMAAMAPTIGLISGVGFTALNMAIGILDGVVARLSLSWLLGASMGMGVLGYYLGNGLAGMVSVLCGAVYFFSGRWKRRALVEGGRP